MTRPSDPAFATSPMILPNGEGYRAFVGLTKREYVAAMAMQGLLACPESCPSVEALSQASIIYADALLSALSK